MAKDNSGKPDALKGARPVWGWGRVVIHALHHTFSRYAGLDVNLLDVESNGDIDKSKFDVFINRIDSADPDDIMIVDTGGNIYLALTDYLNSKCRSRSPRGNGTHHHHARPGHVRGGYVSHVEHPE